MMMMTHQILDDNFFDWMHQNSEMNHNLLDLPFELLEHLFERYLSFQDKLCLRQVHPRLRFLSDVCQGINACLNESDAFDKLDFLSQVAIRGVQINGWPKGGDEGSNNPRFDDLFLYPQHLREVTLKGKIEGWGALSDLIRNCEGLESLTLTSGTRIHASSFTQHEASGVNRHILPEIDIFSENDEEKKTPYYFPNLRFLKLLNTPGKAEQGPTSSDLNCETLLTIMKAVKSCRLERFVAQGWISHRFSVSKLSLAATDVLLRNPTLTSFFFGVIYEHHKTNRTPLTQEEAGLRPSLEDKLKKAGGILRLKKFGISTTSGDMTLWSQFVCRQETLVHISLTVDLVDGLLSSAVFHASRNTLSQLILRGKFTTSFDFTWVEDCSKLREICLHNIDHADVDEDIFHVINAALIPTGVQSLVLFQTVVRTEEIKTALRRLKGLETLVLFRTGNLPGETGVNVDCLKLVLDCRTLQSLLLVRFVAGSPSDAIELVKILQKLNKGLPPFTREATAAPVLEIIGDGDDGIEEIREEEEDDDDDDYDSSDDEEPPPLVDGDYDSDDDDDEGSDSLDLDCSSIPEDTPEDESASIALDDETDAPTITDNENTSKPVVEALTRGRKRKHPDVASSSSSSVDSGADEGDETNADEEEDEVEAVDDDDDEEDEDPAPDGVDEDETWTDYDSEDTDDLPVDLDDDEPINLDLDPDHEWPLELNLDMDMLRQLAALSARIHLGRGGGGGRDRPMEGHHLPDGGQIHVLVNLIAFDALADLLEMFVPVHSAVEALNANNNNNNQIQVGFILDGVIDLQPPEDKDTENGEAGGSHNKSKSKRRSKWTAADDENGQLTYSLRISVD